MDEAGKRSVLYTRDFCPSMKLKGGGGGGAARSPVRDLCPSMLGMGGGEVDRQGRVGEIC